MYVFLMDAMVLASSVKSRTFENDCVMVVWNRCMQANTGLNECESSTYFQVRNEQNYLLKQIFNCFHIVEHYIIK